MEPPHARSRPLLPGAIRTPPAPPPAGECPDRFADWSSALIPSLCRRRNPAGASATPTAPAATAPSGAANPFSGVSLTGAGAGAPKASPFAGISLAAGAGSSNPFSGVSLTGGGGFGGFAAAAAGAPAATSADAPASTPADAPAAAPADAPAEEAAAAGSPPPARRVAEHGSKDAEEGKPGSSQEAGAGGDAPPAGGILAARGGFGGFAASFGASAGGFGGFAAEAKASAGGDAKDGKPAGGSIFGGKPLTFGTSQFSGLKFDFSAGASGAANGGSSLFSASAKDKPAMEAQEVKTGEEHEDTVAACQAKLFEFSSGAWKERGAGEVRRHPRGTPRPPARRGGRPVKTTTPCPLTRAAPTRGPARRGGANPKSDAEALPPRPRGSPRGPRRDPPGPPPAPPAPGPSPKPEPAPPPRSSG